MDLRDDSNGNTMVPQWDTMVSSLRPHTTLSQHNWMLGSFDGVPALVTYYFRDGGSSADTHYTHAMAWIDPPLFLGLHVSRRTWLCGVPRIGVPLFDEKLYVQSFQPERGHAMVWPGRNPPLADVALSAVARGMAPDIYDSFAATTVSRFEASTDFLRGMLTHAVAMARAAGERRVMVGDTREEAAMGAEWAHFAERDRFAFDPARRVLTGAFQGLESHVLTRSTPTALWNQVLLGLPTDTGLHVDVTPESGFTRFANVIGFSDIEVGDAAFDRALRLKGAPAPLVQALFAREESRASALGLVSKYGRFSVHGRFLTLGTPRVATTEAELRELLTDVTGFAKAVLGRAAPQEGPYRR
jgi:hypothetical protein